jgi:DivIVA domain-containing protein
MRPRRLQPEDIDAVQFSTTRFRPGYAEDEVDEFLDAIREDLRCRQRVARLPGGRDRIGAMRRLQLTAEAIQRKTFHTVRLQEGYAPSDVDAFLERAIEEFRLFDRELRGYA